MKKWIGLFLVMTSISAMGQDSLRVTYIGNMGVLLQHGHHSVLIDGLHDFYKSYYLPPTDDMVEGIISGTYKKIGNLDAILITHEHEDHYDRFLTQQLLKQQPNATLFAGSQIVSQISLTDQVHTIPYTGEFYQTQTAAIKIVGFKIPHSSDRFKHIQNVGWIVSMGDFKVLHIGDTEWSRAEQILKQVKDEQVDLAIFPFWMVTTKDDYDKAMSLTGAQKIAACHFTPGDDYITKLESINPDVILLVEQGKTIRISK